MRVSPIMVALVFCLLLASCARHGLPPIKDAAVLCADCSTLFQKFPTEEIPTNASPDSYISKLQDIPKEQWPTSIAGLNPGKVSKNDAGIWIFITSQSKNPPTDPGNNNIVVGYFVLINPGKMPLPNDLQLLRMDKNSMGLIFKSTGFGNVYQIEQPMAVL